MQRLSKPKIVAQMSATFKTLPFHPPENCWLKLKLISRRNKKLRFSKRRPAKFSRPQTILQI
jgi:hypothetical protein